MVFSSVPTYLDPSNWQQQPNDHGGSSLQLNELVPPPPPPPPQQPYVVDSIRPGSMAERARLANIPFPEAPLKCPRCESTNTKFCYFNNYCLTQPRHFCKTCKRYWTRGGALRTIPVGGGCRRNKRSKAAANSKSPSSSSSTSTVSSNTTGPGGLLGLMPPHFPALRFLSPLGQFTDAFNSGDIGLSSPMMGSFEPNFQSNLICGIGGSNEGSIEQWRLQNLQQFPFLGGGGSLDTSPAGFHQFQGTIEPSCYMGQTSSNMRPEMSTSILTQMASIKMEGNQGLNLSRQLMGLSGNDSWTDFNNFSTSSTSNP